MIATGHIEELKRLKVARVKCQSSLLFHYRYFFYHNYHRKAVINHHHIIIINALERVLRGELKRLIINIAPRYNKTEIAVKSFIAHGLSINPAAKFIHLSYSDDLALDNSEQIKDTVESEPYQQLFPEVKVKFDSKAKTKWYTTKGGGVLARAAGGSVTGFGAGTVDDPDADIEAFLSEKEGFGGAIIIDDPIKPEEADSATIRERVNERFDSTIRNRVNSRNTPIIVIMQRLHPEDLSGYLQREEEADQWEVITLPCLYFDDAGQKQALWPFKHTVEELEALERANDIVFQRQYQQNPEPKEGLLFPKDDLNYYNPENVDVNKLVEFKFGVIDPADEGGDDLSFPVGYLIGNKIYITDVIYNSHGTDVNEPACVEKIIEHKLNAAVVEGNSAWILFAKSVRTKVTERYQHCEIRIIKNTTNKHTRIQAQAAFIRNHFVFRSDYAKIPQYSRFMKNLTTYNRIQEGTSKNKHDDAPDSAAEMAAYFQTNFVHLW